MRRIAQGFTVVIVAGLLGLLIWDVAHQRGSKIASSLAKGDPYPAWEFTKPKLTGSGNLSLASYRGKVVVLNFWATWCMPCKAEAKTLQTAAEKWKSKDVVFLGVNEDSLNGDAHSFLKRYGITYPQVKDNGSLEGHYGVTGYPETFFINAKGVVVPPHIEEQANASALAQGIENAEKA